MICKKCRSTEIKSRRNYTHGTKSRATTTMTCKKCGSMEMEAPQKNTRKRSRK